jgi:hypothetical protein
MCAAASATSPPDEGIGPAWRAAAGRARAYLEAAGLKPEAAGELAREIVAGSAAERPGAAEDEAVLAALRTARRLLMTRSPREGQGTAERPLAPRDQPLSIRRRAFRSLIDWRSATLRIRRLVPALAPRRVRHVGGGRSRS